MSSLDIRFTKRHLNSVIKRNRKIAVPLREVYTNVVHCSKWIIIHYGYGIFIIHFLLPSNELRLPPFDCLPSSHLTYTGPMLMCAEVDMTLSAYIRYILVAISQFSHFFILLFYSCTQFIQRPSYRSIQIMANR